MSVLLDNTYDTINMRKENIFSEIITETEENYMGMIIGLGLIIFQLICEEIDKNQPRMS